MATTGPKQRPRPRKQDEPEGKRAKLIFPIKIKNLVKVWYRLDKGVPQGVEFLQQIRLNKKARRYFGESKSHELIERLRVTVKCFKQLSAICPEFGSDNARAGGSGRRQPFPPFPVSANESAKLYIVDTGRAQRKPNPNNGKVPESDILAAARDIIKTLGKRPHIRILRMQLREYHGILVREKRLRRIMKQY